MSTARDLQGDMFTFQVNECPVLIQDNNSVQYVGKLGTCTVAISLPTYKCWAENVPGTTYEIQCTTSQLLISSSAPTLSFDEYSHIANSFHDTFVLKTLALGIRKMIIRSDDSCFEWRCASKTKGGGLPVSSPKSTSTSLVGSINPPIKRDWLCS